MLSVSTDLMFAVSFLSHERKANRKKVVKIIFFIIKDILKAKNKEKKLRIGLLYIIDSPYVFQYICTVQINVK